ncbi:type I glyceraldehyde-3-phosphate dehydrogenase [Candidatus Woesearchaeota archaeon CG10_big_fil_rev_8_21_14_0_10_36_11]|nr:MAG: type I glyceraldehyde-3-phosphate dehydrogenase [Candidatus Woesearchaeota archaeon CG10_big_fil_rev_8_21_14_0_10_36_11]
MINVAINGFGRIGRMVFRAGYKDKKINFVAINDLTDTKNLAHLLQYDSVHGPLLERVTYTKNSLIIGNKKVHVFAEKDPTCLPWKKYNVDVVVESTGLFRAYDDAKKHLQAGATKVLLSANCKNDDTGKIKTLIKGVNLEIYNKSKDHIVSKGSCTTTCLSPIVKVLHDALGIERGFMTTVHSVTNTQRILDAPHKDLREARSILNNIIPTETGAAVAVTRVIPALKSHIDGMAMRVPTQDGSIVDFTCIVKKNTSVEEVNKIFKNASTKSMKGIIQYSEEELVSTDIIGNPYSAIFDSKLTKVDGRMVKILAWYDNEWGYSSRMVDMIKFMF